MNPDDVSILHPAFDAVALTVDPSDADHVLDTESYVTVTITPSVVAVCSFGTVVTVLVTSPTAFTSPFLRISSTLSTKFVAVEDDVHVRVNSYTI